MNRKRLSTETLKEYHTSMKEEVQRVRTHLMGNYIHVSKTYTAEGMPMPGITRKGSFKDD